MKFALPASGGNRLPPMLWRLLVGAAVWTTIGCQSAEPYKPSPMDTSGSGGAGSALQSSGGSGGEPFGSGGAGGAGTGGSINPGTGGSINPGTGGSGTGGFNSFDASAGSGGSMQPDASADTSGGVDSPPAISPYCQRTGWTATASVMSTGATRPANGIDGDLTTRWGNGRFQDGTDWYKVDFGGLVRLDSITLDNTMTYPTDCPGAHAVYGSTDGTTFTGPFATGNGTEGKTVIQFPAQSVRAIKINQTGLSRKAYWWQIGELQIHCL